MSIHFECKNSMKVETEMQFRKCRPQPSNAKCTVYCNIEAGYEIPQSIKLHIHMVFNCTFSIIHIDPAFL